MVKKSIIYFLLVFFCLKTYAQWPHNIYEVNIRQYSPEGSFNAFAQDLPRLQKMGIDMIWLMPIYPIGEEKRKGSLGSYYAVKDFMDINNEFGNQNDFRNLVNKAHSLNIKVILDWVPDHTSWDHKWIKDFPSFYKKDSLGKIISPFDWTDVAQLDYNNPSTQDVMIEALRYWVNEFDVDGFRQDVAFLVHTKFWEKAQTEILSPKKLFWLAEAEEDSLNQVFDVQYGWNWLHLMDNFAKGKKDAYIKMTKYVNDVSNDRHKNRIYFTTNHDENSWNGSEIERYQKNYKNFTALCISLPGIPLIYNGQELPLQKRLRFFEKDTIFYQNSNLIDLDFLTHMLSLNKKYSILDPNLKEFEIETLRFSKKSKKIFGFQKINNNKSAIVICNFDENKSLDFRINNLNISGEYINTNDNTIVVLEPKTLLHLKPNEFVILIKD